MLYLTNKLKIARVNWLEKSIGEAEVVLTDGQEQLVCFGHPFLQSEDEWFRGKIYPWVSSEIMVSFEKNYQIKYLGDWKYFFVGILLDGEEGTVQVGNFKLTGLEYIPKDIANGMYVEFEALRCDIY